MRALHDLLPDKAIKMMYDAWPCVPLCCNKKIISSHASHVEQLACKSHYWKRCLVSLSLCCFQTSWTILVNNAKVWQWRIEKNVVWLNIIHLMTWTAESNEKFQTLWIMKHLLIHSQQLFKNFFNYTIPWHFFITFFYTFVVSLSK